MKILALETTGKYGSAAVFNGEKVVTACSQNEMNHLKDVISISEKALSDAGVDKKELTHIAASVGPGSFTGIRIGVTTARTVAQMLLIPCVAVSSLQGLCYNALEPAKQAGCELIVPIINARRHQTYAGAWKTGECEACLEERQYMIEELLELVKDRKVFFTGDGIDAYGDIIKDTLEAGQFVFADESIRYQTAETVALAARELIAKGYEVQYEDLLPNYMRLSEAEQRLKEGTLSSKIKDPTVI